jgi:hypothetical protein
MTQHNKPPHEQSGGGFFSLFGLSGGTSHDEQNKKKAQEHAGEGTTDTAAQKGDETCAKVSENLDLGHRHFSPMHYLFPGIFWPGTGAGAGAAISPSATASTNVTTKAASAVTSGHSIYEAGRMFMRARRENGGGHTSWSAGWEACLWAR